MNIGDKVEVSRKAFVGHHAAFYNAYVSNGYVGTIDDIVRLPDGYYYHVKFGPAVMVTKAEHCTAITYQISLPPGYQALVPAIKSVYGDSVATHLTDWASTCEHTYAPTGTRKSWCTKCNLDARWNSELMDFEVA